MPRSVYVHETIDIVGQGQYDYMEHLWQDPVLRMPEMTSLQGSFYVLGFGGGRWPQVINIWDCGDDGWEGWGRNLDRLNLKRRRAFYGDWWDTAAQWRTGGFDRVCAGVPGSPTTAEIAGQGLRGTLFVNEVLTVRPGAQLEYLAAVVDQRVPLLTGRGVQATGLWQVVNNLHEVVMVWATSVDDWVRLRRDIDTTRGLDDTGEADDRLVAWEGIAAGYVTGGDTHVMTPLPRTVYGPPDWDEASLDDWLAGEPQEGEGRP
jgi:hypothetical protein